MTRIVIVFARVVELEHIQVFSPGAFHPLPAAYQTNIKCARFLRPYAAGQTHFRDIRPHLWQ